MARTAQPPKKREQDPQLPLLLPPLIPAPVPVYTGPALPSGAPVQGTPMLQPGPLQSVSSGPSRVFNMGGPAPTSSPAVGSGTAPRLLTPGPGASAAPGSGGRVFNMGGPRPTPLPELGPGMAPKMLPSAGGSGAGGGGGAAAAGGAAAGGAAAGGVAAALRAGAGAAVRALPWLGGVAGAATYDALGRQDVQGAFADENSGLRKAMAQAAQEQAAYKAQGNRPGELGAEIRNAANVGWEGLKAYAYPKRTVAFLEGLFGGPAEAPVAAAPAPPTGQVPAFVQAARAAAPAAPSAPENRGRELTFDQLVPLMQAMPQMMGGGQRPLTGKDALYARAMQDYDERKALIAQAPVSDEQKSRMLDQLTAQLYSLLGEPLMQFDDQME